MQFLVGKKVAVLDDILKGVIVSIDDQIIGVKDSDGMVYQYNQKELVLIEEDQYQLSKFSDINNANALSESIKEVLYNPQLNNKLHQNSLKAVHQYSWQSITTQLSKIYEAVTP